MSDQTFQLRGAAFHEQELPFLEYYQKEIERGVASIDNRYLNPHVIMRLPNGHAINLQMEASMLGQPARVAAAIAERVRKLKAQEVLFVVQGLQGVTHPEFATKTIAQVAQETSLDPASVPSGVVGFVDAVVIQHLTAQGTAAHTAPMQRNPGGITRLSEWIFSPIASQELEFINAVVALKAVRRA